MPGREDFGILKARALADPRVLRASELYIEKKLARAETAHAAVLGHLTCLGLWASRETNSGSIPGDGVAVVSAATLSGPTVARVIVGILRAKDVDLITGDDGDLRLRGFVDAYRPLIAKREGNARRTDKWRREKASRDGDGDASRDGHGDGSRDGCGDGSSAGQPDRTGPDRTPLPPGGGNGGGGSGRSFRPPPGPPEAWWGENRWGQFVGTGRTDPEWTAAVEAAAKLPREERLIRASSRGGAPDIERAACSFVAHRRGERAR